MCTDEAHIDIPVPDFTFEDYPETGYANTSFWAIKELLLHKESMVSRHLYGASSTTLDLA
jgi:hypothetical protein